MDSGRKALALRRGLGRGNGLVELHEPLKAVYVAHDIIGQRLGGAIEHHGRVDVSSDMTRHDDERLRQLIIKHREYTGSAHAAEILDNWETYRPKFVKVMPTEYRRALAEIEAAQNAAGVAAE